uniref:Uncharacterized protein n=1 Tax=Anguilla anguilla TaxID=7936 RepID=A0A0E9USN4_ANGAN
MSWLPLFRMSKKPKWWHSIKPYWMSFRGIQSSDYI